MSNTPYKDELIRIASLLGLADDVELSTLADQIAALCILPDAVVTLRRWAGVTPDLPAGDVVAHLEEHVPSPLDMLRRVQNDGVISAQRYTQLLQVQGLADDLRGRAERAGGGQAYADMLDVSARLAALAMSVDGQE